MLQHGSAGKLGASVTLIALSLVALSPAAQSAVTASCGYRDSIFNGEVDFGSGNHSLGAPANPGTVSWRLAASNGAVFATARVQGTLFLDKLGAGCARLRINFQDVNSNNLQGTTDRRFCGPGFNANSPSNHLAIDVTSLPNSQLRRVQLTLGEGQTAGTIEDLHTGSSVGPSANLIIPDTINNGSNDFGGNSHSGGGPSSPAHMSLTLANNGIVFGNVDGVLYWDALFGGGTSQIITDFQRSDGTTLQSRTNRVTGPGGNANDDHNKVGVVRSFNSSSLSRIRLRVGGIVNGGFVNVVTRTYAYGASCN
jgi:hypothetical protein